MLLSVINEAEERTGTRPSKDNVLVAFKWAKRNGALRKLDVEGTGDAEKVDRAVTNLQSQGIETEPGEVAYFIYKLLPKIIRRERFYRTDRAQATKALADLFRTCKSCVGMPLNSRVNVGRGVKIIVGQPGTNITDLAQYVLSLNLGLDFTVAAQRYDSLRPTYNYRKASSTIDRAPQGSSAEEKAEVKKARTDHQSAAIDQYMRKIQGVRDVDNEQLFGASEFGKWSEARRAVARMAKGFLEKIQGDVLSKFAEMYPESYWEFLDNQDDQKVFYTSDAAVPVSINSLGRATKVSAHQSTVAQYYINIQSKVNRAINRASKVKVKDMEEYRYQVQDIIKDMNADIDPTGGLSVTLNGIDERMKVADIVDALHDAGQKFLGKVGRILLRKCMPPNKIPSDDQEVQNETAKCEEPLGGFQLAGGTFSFSLGFEGNTPRALGFTLEKHHSGSKGEADWAKPKTKTEDPQILDMVKRDPSRGHLPPGSSNPSEEVIYQFKAPDYLNDDSGEPGEPVWMAVRLERQEAYARGLDQKGNIIEHTGTVDELVKHQLDSYHAASGRARSVYENWVRYRSVGGMKEFREAAQEAFQSGDSGNVQDLIDEIGVPVQVKLTSGDASKDKRSPSLAQADADIGEQQINSFVRTLFLFQRPRHTGSYYMHSGYFPSGVIMLDADGANWEKLELVPVFFTSEEGRGLPQRDYNHLLQHRKWPSYADNNGKIDPNKLVSVKYVDESGEQREETLTAQQVYEHGLDRPRVHDKFGTELVGEQSDDGIEYIDEPIFFFTSAEHNQPESKTALSGEPCVHCSGDQPVYHASEDLSGVVSYTPNPIWDPRLKFQGREPSELIKITFDDGLLGTQGNTAIIRRHELFDRSSDLSDRMQNLHIAPYFPDSEFGAYAIKNNRLEAIKLGDNRDEAEHTLKRLRSEAELDRASADDDNLTLYPEGLDDTIDYGDRTALDEAEKKSRYFNPFQGENGSYNTINSNDFSKSQKYYRDAIDGRFNIDDDSRDNLLIDPHGAGKSQAWVSVEGDTIFVTWPVPGKVGEHIGSDNNPIVDNKIAADGEDPKGMENYLSDDKAYWKTPVYPDSGGNYVVDMPYFINFRTSVQRMQGDTFGNNEKGAFKTLLKIPVTDPESVSIRFIPGHSRGSRYSKKRKGRRRRDGTKVVKPNGVPLSYGVHYEFNPATQNREIIWLGEYAPRMEQEDDEGNPLPTLLPDDRLEITFDEEDIGNLYFSTSAVPFSRALDIAKDRWRDFEISRRRFQTSKGGAIQAQVDVNGIARIENTPAMSWLRSFDGNAAKTFDRKYGRFLCGRPVRSALRGSGSDFKGSEKRAPCPNPAAHPRLPRMIVQTKKAKVFIRDRQDRFAEYESQSDQDSMVDLQSIGSAIVPPDWTWVNGAAVKMRDMAETDRISNWFGKQGRDKALAQADSADRRGGNVATAQLAMGSHAGGMCHPCWMAQFEIVPKKIIEDMWSDLTEIESIATKMLTKSELELEQSDYEREITGASGASYSPRGYKSKMKKSSESEAKRLMIRKTDSDPTEWHLSDISGDSDAGYAYVEDEFGEKSYEWVRVSDSSDPDERGAVERRYPMMSWVKEWMQNNPKSARHMDIVSDEADDRAMGMMRIKIDDVDKADWHGLMKYISSKHRSEGGNSSGWQYLDPDRYEPQLDSEKTGFDLRQKTGDDRGVLVIRHDRAFGPTESETQIWKNVATDTEHEFDASMIIKADPVSENYGKGYERSVGRLYQITMPDGTPRVVEIVNFSGDEEDFNDQEQVKVRFMDQADESAEDLVVSAILRTVEVSDPRKVRQYVENADQDKLFKQVRDQVTQDISDEDLGQTFSQVVDNWRIAYRNYNDNSTSDEMVLPRSVLGEDQGGPTPLDTRLVKMLIMEKLAEFYINYLAIETSFWVKIKNEIDGLDGMQDSQKVRLVGRLIGWQSFLKESFEELTDPDTGMMDQGVTPRDFNGPAGIPWFSVSVQRFMRQVGNLYFWTQYLKRRYGNRSALDVNDPAVVPITQLTRKDVRDRQAYYAALNDSGYKPTRLFTLSNYHRGNVNREESYGGRPGDFAESVEKEDKVLIYNVGDARYLNGLTGIVEGKHDGYWVVQLDENAVVEPERVLLAENEVLFFHGAPMTVLTETTQVESDEEFEEEYKDLVLEEVAQDKLKDDLIDLIGEFTSEHPSWD